jgi:hypothetical protein
MKSVRLVKIMDNHMYVVLYYIRALYLTNQSITNVMRIKMCLLRYYLFLYVEDNHFKHRQAIISIDFW